MAESELNTRVARYGDETECFLEILPPPIPRYIYQDSQQFHQILDADYDSTHFQNLNCMTTEDNSTYIIFLSDPPSFEAEFDHRDTGGPLGFHYEYNPPAKVLIIKTNTRIHRCAARAMNTIIEGALRDMELVWDFESFAGVEVSIGAGNWKVPNEGWAPLINAHEAKAEALNGHKPTVVLEVDVGVSQIDEAKLRDDAGVWVHPERGQANIAITIMIQRDRNRPLITIEKWEWDAVTCRPQVTCHIEIAGAGRGTVSVLGEPLVIPFLQIWRREARGPRGRDKVVTAHDFVVLATYIWRVMG
ncbi:unnamed protein product, partial [Penicillium pancosmium]